MPLDPFDTLGLPPTFGLTSGAIERAYLRASARLHPDLAGAGVDTQARAEGDASDLNAAAATLRDPESRAIALLARLGGPSKEQDRSLPEGFLQDILDTRMQIEESRHDPAARSKWESWASAQRREYSARCASLFERALPNPGGSPDAACLAEIRRTLNAWRYIERLIEQLDPGYDPNRADFRA